MKKLLVLFSFLFCLSVGNAQQFLSGSTYDMNLNYQAFDGSFWWNTDVSHYYFNIGSTWYQYNLLFPNGVKGQVLTNTSDTTQEFENPSYAFGGSGSTLVALGARYFCPSGNSGGQSSADNVASMISPITGTIRNLYVKSTAPGIGSGDTVMFNINGTDKPILHVIITGTNTSGSDLTDTLNVSAGDAVSIRANASLLSLLGSFSWGFIIK